MLRETEPGLVAFYNQETETVYSYNPGARTAARGRVTTRVSQRTFEDNVTDHTSGYKEKA